MHGKTNTRWSAVAFENGRPAFRLGYVFDWYYTAQHAVVLRILRSVCAVCFLLLVWCLFFLG